MDKMEAHLKTTYGFNKFREYQKDIICDLLNRENVFAILPTGGGKSLLYQFPATYTKKLTIVISPLISLMNDQCRYLNSKNIKSICLNSETNVEATKYKNYQIIYATPEFLTSRIKVFESVSKNIGLFAVDEAHCVSQWSHDFRESYQKLGIIKKKFPQIPLLAVTATATPHVLDEMYQFLNITEVCEYSLGTRRTNLEIRVRSKSEFSECVFNEPTIIYVQTRKICEKLSDDLKAKGVRTAYYHGGMEKADKDLSHELFVSGEIMVIVATISFGMGIDKSDIRHVINYGVPSDIESYYQEIGRAGRDGINSRATIYYNSQDFATTALLISKSSEMSQRQIKTDAMNKFRSYLGENTLCRQQMIDYYFETGEFLTTDKTTHIPKCNICDNCCRTRSQNIKDLSEEATVVVRVIQENYNTSGYNLGMEKTIKIVSHDNNAVFRGKTKKFIRDVIDILAMKNILERRAVGRWGALVIGLGKTKLSKCLPLMAHIDDSVPKKGKYFTTMRSKLLRLTQIRDKIAKNHGLIPTMFMNDRIMMNILEKCPKNMTELWGVDGISDEFISTYGVDFMKEAKFIITPSCPKVQGKSKQKKITAKEEVLLHFREGKSVEEIAYCRGVSKNTIEHHLLSILETEDVDIDPDYFGLTEDYEHEIKRVIERIGLERLSAIKEQVNPNISYTHIKLCIIILRIESSE